MSNEWNKWELIKFKHFNALHVEMKWWNSSLHLSFKSVPILSGSYCAVVNSRSVPWEIYEICALLTSLTFTNTATVQTSKTECLSSAAASLWLGKSPTQHVGQRSALVCISLCVIKKKSVVSRGSFRKTFNYCLSSLMGLWHRNTFSRVKPLNQSCSQADTRFLPFLLLVLQLLTWQTAETFSAFPYFCCTPIGQCFIWPVTIG